jgi:cell division protein FtsA
MAKDHQNIIVGLDIGTSKTMAIVADIGEGNELKVLGYGMHLSDGLKKGMVVDIEATQKSIQSALTEAEMMSGCRITEVYTDISGNHIRSLNSEGTVAVKDKNEVVQGDVDRAMEVAKTKPIPSTHQILHSIPQEFSVDDQEDIRKPLEMSGSRLTVKVHLVSGASAAVANLVRCVRRCGVEVCGDVMLQPLVAAEAVLTEDEKNIGVCLVDIGGGTTDIAIYTGGVIRHTEVIPVAGDQVTSDIVMLLRTPTKEAENIKVLHGCALRQLADQNDIIEVPGVAGHESRKLSRHALAEVIEPRVEELYGMVLDALSKSGYQPLIASGIVLTGGSSQLEGMVELGEEVFHLPVRVGVPMYEGPLAEIVKNPRFAAATGLLFAGREHWLRTQAARNKTQGVRGIFHGIGQWFKANF